MSGSGDEQCRDLVAGGAVEQLLAFIMLLENSTDRGQGLQVLAGLVGRGEHQDKEMRGPVVDGIQIDAGSAAPEAEQNLVEPVDLAVARSLWAWPMSPQEKSIVVATARQASLGQTADILGISPGTLTGSINALLTAVLGSGSRYDASSAVAEFGLQ